VSDEIRRFIDYLDEHRAVFDKATALFDC
jgi:hypothetical protein